MKGIPESGYYMKLVMIIKAEICSILKFVRAFCFVFKIVFRILTRFAHMFDNMTLVTVSPPEYDTPTVSPQEIMMPWARFLQILDMPI